VDQEWWSQAQRDIAKSEYQIRSDGAGNGVWFHAPNRAQNFRTLCTPQGFRVIPRVSHASEAPAWSWGRALASWGPHHDMQSADAAELRINGNRLEYYRPGLIEWYTNDERGLEQGFIVNDRHNDAQRSGPDDPLRVEMTIDGTVIAELTDAGRGIDFLASGGARAIRFDRLSTVDAAGQALTC
jgi:hypothetical protein